MAWNALRFKGQETIPDLVAAQGLSILSYFPQYKDSQAICVVTVEQIDFSIPWDFFYGASLKNNQSCGGGGCHVPVTTTFFQNQDGTGPKNQQLRWAFVLETLTPLFWWERGKVHTTLWGLHGCHKLGPKNIILS
jgi:hypothetical protein